MKKDAELHAEEDKKKKDLIEARNTADTMIYTTEKMMKDVAEKKITVTDEEKKKVDDGLALVKELKEKDDLEALKKAADDLSTAAQAIGMKMYQQEQQAEKTAEPATEAKTENGPVEGEVIDDKEQK